MRNYIKIIIVCCLSLVAKVQAQELTFISPEVEEGIRQHINIAEDEQISFLHLDTITVLDLSKRGITDIRDLVLLPSLRTLDLCDNMVEDLRPLTVLESLEWVDLSYNHLKGINDLFYSTAKNLTVNVAFNYISDFSLFCRISSCDFILEGAELQLTEEAPYIDINYLYSNIDEEEKPVIAYRGYTNTDAAWSVKYGSTDTQALLDGDSHKTVLDKMPAETAVATLTNGESSISTYIVPPITYLLGAGTTVTLETGLPEDYHVSSVFASNGTVEIVGNTMKYTAPNDFVSDIVSFSYYQESILKGFSHFYLNRTKKGDVNGDGEVNETDLQLIVNYIMNPSDDFNRDAADMNGDTKVNAADLVLLVNEIKKLSQ